MSKLSISDDEDFASLRDKVVVVTGGSSGIGRATCILLLKHGAKVVVGDLQEDSTMEDNSLEFVKVNVTSWNELKALFKTAIDKYGRVDHVFANAGVSTITDLIKDEYDEGGLLKEPNHITFEINFKAVANTIRLGIHHIRQNPSRGSIVLTASASAFQRFPAVDYTAAKHGVLGLMRALYPLTGTGTETGVRINSISPSWTYTGIVPRDAAQKAGIRGQEPEAAARSAAKLMADDSMHGKLIYSVQGKYTEIEEAMNDSIGKILDRCDSVDPRTQTETEELYALMSQGFEAV